MKIGIIGAGNIGGNLTRRLTAIGHEVAVANSRASETLADLAAETGASNVALGSVAAGADLVIVTIPERAIPLLPAGLFDGLGADAPIVDTGNYYPGRDGRIAEIEDGMTESRWVSRQLGRPVVKVFNTVYAHNLLDRPQAAGTPGRMAIPLAGDHDAAKGVVSRLVDEMGFDPVDAGTIDESWRQQPGSPVYAADLDADGVRAALATAGPERPKDFRA